MSVALLRARSWFRANRRVAIPVALAIGLVAGVVLGVVAGARRTASAPDRYTSEMGGDPDAYIYQPLGDPLPFADAPGVVKVQRQTFVTAFPRLPDGSLLFEPNPFAGDDRLGGARLVEGRFTDPSNAHEFTISKVLAERHKLVIGRSYEIAGFSQQLVIGGDIGPTTPTDVRSARATLVGIFESPLDFDQPSQAIVYSQAFFDANPQFGRIGTIALVRLRGTTPDEYLQSVQAMPGGEGVHREEVRIVSVNARRAVRYQSSALWITVGLTAAGALAIVAILAARTVSTGGGERATMRALGASRGQLGGEVALEAAGLAALAVPIAILTSAIVNGAFPLGTLRTFELHAGPRLDGVTAGIGAPAIVALVVITGVVAAARGDRRRTPATSTRVAVGSRVPLVVGAHLAADGATSNRGGARSVLLGAFAVAGIVASLVVGRSITSMSTDQSRWGVNYELLIGNPFVPAAPDYAAPIIDDPDVTAIELATQDFLPIDDVAVPVFAFQTVRGGLQPTVLEGRLPASTDEIALGASMMRRLHRGIGDTVRAAGDDGATATLRVVGSVVTPQDAGDGSAMTFDGFAKLRKTATKNLLLVNLRKHAAEATAQRLASIFTPPDALQVPTSVGALRRTTPAPSILLAILGLFLVIATAYRLTMSTRFRRHDLAVLRALGADGGQLRRAIHWHATLIAGVAMLVGLPLGVIVGRKIVITLTDTFGIVPGTTLPWATFAIGAVGLAALANVLAAIPARWGARAGAEGLSHHG